MSRHHRGCPAITSDWRRERNGVEAEPARPEPEPEPEPAPAAEAAQPTNAPVFKVRVWVCCACKSPECEHEAQQNVECGRLDWDTVCSMAPNGARLVCINDGPKSVPADVRKVYNRHAWKCLVAACQGRGVRDVYLCGSRRGGDHKDAAGPTDDDIMAMFAGVLVVCVFGFFRLKELALVAPLGVLALFCACTAAPFWLASYRRNARYLEQWCVRIGSTEGTPEQRRLHASTLYVPNSPGLAERLWATIRSALPRVSIKVE